MKETLTVPIAGLQLTSLAGFWLIRLQFHFQKSLFWYLQWEEEGKERRTGPVAEMQGLNKVTSLPFPFLFPFPASFHNILTESILDFCIQLVARFQIVALHLNGRHIFQGVGYFILFLSPHPSHVLGKCPQGWGKHVCCGRGLKFYKVYWIQFGGTARLHYEDRCQRSGME